MIRAFNDTFGNTEVSAEAWSATYSVPHPEEAMVLLRKAKEYENRGDYVAMHDLERDAKAVIQMAHLKRAIEWDKKLTNQ